MTSSSEHALAGESESIDQRRPSSAGPEGDRDRRLMRRLFVGSVIAAMVPIAFAAGVALHRGFVPVGDYSFSPFVPEMCSAIKCRCSARRRRCLRRPHCRSTTLAPCCSTRMHFPCSCSAAVPALSSVLRFSIAVQCSVSRSAAYRRGRGWAGRRKHGRHCGAVLGDGQPGSARPDAAEQFAAAVLVLCCAHLVRLVRRPGGAALECRRRQSHPDVVPDVRLPRRRAECVGHRGVGPLASRRAWCRGSLVGGKRAHVSGELAPSRAWCSSCVGCSPSTSSSLATETHLGCCGASTIPVSADRFCRWCPTGGEGRDASTVVGASFLRKLPRRQQGRRGKSWPLAIGPGADPVSRRCPVCCGPPRRGARLVCSDRALLRRSPERTRAIATAGVLIAAGLVTAGRMPLGVFGFVTSHTFRWLWPLSAFVSLAVGMAIARPLKRRVRPSVSSPVS